MQSREAISIWFMLFALLSMGLLKLNWIQPLSVFCGRFIFLLIDSHHLAVLRMWKGGIACGLSYFWFGWCFILVSWVTGHYLFCMCRILLYLRKFAFIRYTELVFHHISKSFLFLPNPSWSPDFYLSVWL